jgi:hypothetical protein
MMDGARESDSAVVAGKPTNKAEPSAAEPVERRAEAKGKGVRLRPAHVVCGFSAGHCRQPEIAVALSQGHPHHEHHPDDAEHAGDDLQGPEDRFRRRAHRAREGAIDSAARHGQQHGAERATPGHQPPHRNDPLPREFQLLHFSPPGSAAPHTTDDVRSAPAAAEFLRP